MAVPTGAPLGMAPQRALVANQGIFEAFVEHVPEVDLAVGVGRPVEEPKVSWLHCFGVARVARPPSILGGVGFIPIIGLGKSQRVGALRRRKAG